MPAACALITHTGRGRDSFGFSSLFSHNFLFSPWRNSFHFRLLVHSSVTTWPFNFSVLQLISRKINQVQRLWFPLLLTPCNEWGYGSSVVGSYLVVLLLVPRFQHVFRAGMPICVRLAMVISTQSQYLTLIQGSVLSTGVCYKIHGNQELFVNKGTEDSY